MKYALVNDERQEAQSKLIGECPCCHNPVIAKCGEVKIDHWAHKGKRTCDPWWENETEWHRGWKGQFPKEWQEVIQYAENGEKHIADVKNVNDYVIEFQSSLIKPEERQAREDFYRKMIWIVDGKKRSRDKDTFMRVWKYSKLVDGRVAFRSLQGFIGKCALLRDWGGRNVPVFFDFGEEMLLGLLPVTKEKKVYLCSVERNVLIASLLQAPQMNSFEALMKGWDHLIENEERYLLWVAKGCPSHRVYLRAN